MDTDKKLLLIGGGGHCRSILDSLLSLGTYQEIGIIDNRIVSSYLEIPVIGNDNDLPQLFANGWTDAFVSVGSTGLSNLRSRLYKMIKNIGFAIPVIIDPSAIVAGDVIIQEGVFVGKRVVVNAGANIDKCSILNSGSIIEHDCDIGAFAHISSGAILCGHVIVGDDSHVGAGSVVRQGVNIGHNTMIGAGSVVVKDITDNVIAYGNPCRVVK